MKSKLLRIIAITAALVLSAGAFAACVRDKGKGFAPDALLREHGFEYIAVPKNTSNGTYEETGIYIKCELTMSFKDFQNYCSELYKTHRESGLAFVGHVTRTEAMGLFATVYCTESESLPLVNDSTSTIRYHIVFSAEGFEEGSVSLSSARHIVLNYQPPHSNGRANVRMSFEIPTTVSAQRDFWRD